MQSLNLSEHASMRRSGAADIGVPKTDICAR